MRTQTRLATVVRALFRRTRFEHQLSEELRFHIDEYTAELIRAGVDPRDAARRARIEFGGVESVREDCRQARGLRLFDEVVQDLRYAARVMRRTPGFTVTAAGTIALCLGANLAIFAVVKAVLLRPLPFPDPDRLVRIYNTYPKANVPDDGASVANYYERRGTVAGLASVSLYRDGNALVGEPGTTEREPVMRVTPEFFATLGSGPSLGRAFLEQEMTAPNHLVAILSDGIWRQRFNADPAIVGQRIRVDGTDRLIVGVLPAAFRLLSSRARVFLPLASEPADRTSARRHSGSSSQMIARLGNDVTIEAAQSAIDGQNTALEVGTPFAAMMRDVGFRSVVAPLHAEHVAAVRPMLLLVQGGALCLLSIGCVNLVNLLLVRATARRKELAVRQAIGGSRARIARQVLVETTLLTISGAAAGLALGGAGIRVLKALGTDTLPLGANVQFDMALAATATVTAFVLAAALALPTAWLALRRPAAGLGTESRGITAGGGLQRLRHAFLASQVALAFALLSGAGLLTLSLREVLAISPGFQSTNIISGQISVPVRLYPDTPTRVAFITRLMHELETQPGVISAGIVTNLPFSGRDLKSAITVKGWVPRANETVRGHYAYSVGGRFLETLRVPLIEGRFLDPAEIQRGERHVVVDADFARRYWPEGGAVGRALFLGPKAGADDEAYTIVGVVGSMKQDGLTDAAATGAVYFPYSSRFSSDLFVVARTAFAPETLAPALRAAVHAADSSLAVSDVQSMDARIADTLVTRRSPAVLAIVFAVLALALTAMGTYGVLGYAVALRRREIAVRMALGAQPGQVRGTFVSLGLRLVAIGSAVGLLAAWMTGRAAGSLLFGVSPMHVPTLIVTAVIVSAVTMAACLLPSMRAARVSPVEALSES